MGSLSRHALIFKRRQTQHRRSVKSERVSEPQTIQGTLVKARSAAGYTVCGTIGGIESGTRICAATISGTASGFGWALRFISFCY
jgi:hypothetical protein